MSLCFFFSAQFFPLIFLLAFIRIRHIRSGDIPSPPSSFFSLPSSPKRASAVSLWFVHHRLTATVFARQRPSSLCCRCLRRCFCWRQWLAVTNDYRRRLYMCNMFVTALTVVMGVMDAADVTGAAGARGSASGRAEHRKKRARKGHPALARRSPARRPHSWFVASIETVGCIPIIVIIAAAAADRDVSVARWAYQVLRCCSALWRYDI